MPDKMIYIPDEFTQTWDRAADLAKKRGKGGMSDLVRTLVKDWIEEEEPPAPDPAEFGRIVLRLDGASKAFLGKWLTAGESRRGDAWQWYETAAGRYVLYAETSRDAVMRVFEDFEEVENAKDDILEGAYEGLAGHLGEVIELDI